MLKNNNIMCLLKKNNQENYPVVKIVAIAHHPYTQIIYLVYLPLVSISRQTQIISEKFSSIEAKVQNNKKRWRKQGLCEQKGNFKNEQA